MKRIGIIGYGTIGSYLYDKISKDTDLKIGFVTDINHDKISGLEEAFDANEFFSNLGNMDLVVEAAMSEAVKEYSPRILSKTDMFVLSVSALHDDEFKHSLECICKENRTRLYIPHGAILGLDGIQDGRMAFENVKVTTIKNPRNFGRNDRDRTVVYEGSTREVCKILPRNVNVHAALALAGLGFDKTYSKVVSEPNTDKNSHIIEAYGQDTNVKIEIHSKRKGLVTGAYTPESVYRTIRRILVPEFGLAII